MELGMVRKFFLRSWYVLALVFVCVVFGVFLLFLSLCSGVKGFVRDFCDTINEGVAAFVDHFGLYAAKPCD